MRSHSWLFFILTLPTIVPTRVLKFTIWFKDSPKSELQSEADTNRSKTKQDKNKKKERKLVFKNSKGQASWGFVSSWIWILKVEAVQQPRGRSQWQIVPWTLEGQAVAFCTVLNSGLCFSIGWLSCIAQEKTIWELFHKGALRIDCTRKITTGMSDKVFISK